MSENKTKNELGSFEDGNNDDFRVPNDQNLMRERLRAALRTSGGNQAVADKSGVPLSTIGGFLGGRNEIRASALVALADACDISLDWLYGREAAVRAETRAPAQLPVDHIEIDRYELHASAGRGSLQFDAPSQSKWIIPREMLNNFKGPEDQLLSTDVVGDSMNPTLQDGQAIIVDTVARFDREGVYLLTIGDELFVKRLRRVPEEDGRLSLSLISDNPAYPEVRLGPDTQERVRIIGRVIWPNTSRRL